LLAAVIVLGLGALFLLFVLLNRCIKLLGPITQERGQRKLARHTL